MKYPTFHHLSYQQVIGKLKTDSSQGLTQAEVIARREKHGLNEIRDDRDKHLVLKLLWHQVNNLLIWVLVAAAIITYFLDHRLDTYVILAVIVLNTIIGFLQEYKANRAIEALQDIVISTCKVFRDGELTEIPSEELVPGDIVLLEEGDRIPADGRLFKARNFQTIESSLTGEAFPIEKHIKILPKKTALADQKNSVWMSTFVASGVAKMVVTSIGAETAIGQIAQDLQKIEKKKSHFEIKTDRLIKQMSFVALSGALFIIFVGLFIRDFSFAEVFSFAVASLVSGIPEGLPAVLIIILATGASRMAKKKAIIRSLPATETLSVTDVVATDKTGTLTQNTMTIKQIQLVDRLVSVKGEGWSPKGSFWLNQEEIRPLNYPSLKKLMNIAGFCSRARLINEGAPEKPQYRIAGDPTEGALTVLAYKAGLKDKLEKKEVKDELPFNPKNKFKAVLVEENYENQILVSGAPEKIISMCSKQQIKNKVKSLSKEEKEQLLIKVKAASSQAMRVIGLAYRTASINKKSIAEHDVKNLTYVGFVGMIDPPRKGVAEAVVNAKQAGIRIIMKTGDHKNTALAIARKVGIATEEAVALTGEELAEMSDSEFSQAVEQVDVFARLTPGMKLKILGELQEHGHTVAMTGDGVNDVLALKKADIGIAMGNIGTDVARESSDIVLADDNFASLIDAIEQGRIVFVNTRQASAFLVTTNFAEDLIMVISILLGFPLPLLATQILWLNLVTDGLVDVALAVEPGHGDVLQSPPRSKHEGILSRKMIGFLTPIILCMVACSIYVFNHYLPEGIDKARTVAFTAMAFTQLFNILNMRSLNLSLFKIGLLSNVYLLGAIALSLLLQFVVMTQPVLMNLFSFVELSFVEVLKIVLLSSSVLIVGEIFKFMRRIIRAEL